jgi:hypothetical protein
MKIENKSGPKQFPYGTPQDIFSLAEKLPLKNNRCVLPMRLLYTSKN